VTTSTAAVARQPNSSLRVEQLEPDEIRPDENRVRLVPFRSLATTHLFAAAYEPIQP
jgi:hypothetical protein